MILPVYEMAKRLKEGERRSYIGSFSQINENIKTFRKVFDGPPFRVFCYSFCDVVVAAAMCRPNYAIVFYSALVFYRFAPS